MSSPTVHSYSRTTKLQADLLGLGLLAVVLSSLVFVLALTVRQVHTY